MNKKEILKAIGMATVTVAATTVTTIFQEKLIGTVKTIITK